MARGKMVASRVWSLLRGRDDGETESTVRHQQYFYTEKTYIHETSQEYSR